MVQLQSPKVIERFLNCAIESPESPALLMRGSNPTKTDSISYQELVEQIDHLGNSLNQRGITQNDFVVQIGHNSDRWIVMDLTLQAMGVVHVPINPTRGVDEIIALVEHCNPKLIIIEDEPLARTLCHKFLAKPNKIVLLEGLLPSKSQTNQVARTAPAGASTDQTAQSNSGEIVTIAKKLQEQVSSFASDQLLTVLYTSGTTGCPKGVMLSHNNIAANVDSLLAVSPIGNHERRLCVLPLSHIFARTNDLYANLCSGSALAIGDPKELAAECQFFKPHFLNGVPYLFKKCMTLYKSLSQTETGQLNGDTIQSFKEFLGGEIEKANSGGASLPREIESFFWEHEIPLTTGYGLTETSPVLTASNVVDHAPGSAGKAVPNVKLKLSDTGEILASGPNVMLGYYKDQQQTDSAIQNHWFHTGDNGEFDNHGNLFISGRKDELIVTEFGFKIRPDNLEELIVTAPFIQQVCVVASKPFLLTAIVVLAEQTGEQLTSETLLPKINQLLTGRSRYEQMGRIIIADEGFSITNGLLTIKGGMRRSEIQKRWGSQSNIDM